MNAMPGSAASTVTRGGRSFRVMGHPLMRAAAAEFCSGFEEGTLRFFDAVLPSCARMVDFGAYTGFTALYAATHVEAVFAFEPHPTNYEFLARNVAENPDLASRIRLFRHGLGARDETVTLYSKGTADSGSSIYREVERQGMLTGAPAATVSLRDAYDVLCEVGLDERTLLKIDIEGAEYEVLPSVGALLAERRPWLHVSFHPFNLMTSGDGYSNALTRLRSALMVAEALAPYRYMHLYTNEAWYSVGPSERMDFLRQYLLAAKPVSRIGTPQYGFVDAVAFSDAMLPPGA